MMALGTVAQAVSVFVEFFMRYCFKLSPYPLILFLSPDSILDKNRLLSQNCYKEYQDGNEFI